MNKKFKGILLGIVTAAALHATGLLLSGIICGGEVLTLYKTARAIWIFPFVFIAVCVSAAFISAENGNKHYFGALMITAVFPYLSCLLFVLPFEGTVLMLPQLIITAPATSVYTKLLELGTASGIVLLSLMLIGYISSAVIYSVKKQ